MVNCFTGARRERGDVRVWDSRNGGDRTHAFEMERIRPYGTNFSGDLKLDRPLK